MPTRQNLIYYFVANLKDFGSLKDGHSHLELIKMEKCQQVITLLTGWTKTEGNMVQKAKKSVVSIFDAVTEVVHRQNRVLEERLVIKILKTSCVNVENSGGKRNVNFLRF